MDDDEDMHSFTQHVIHKFNADQLMAWHERAGIMEYDAKMDRIEAEYKAALEILTQITNKLRGRR